MGAAGDRVKRKVDSDFCTANLSRKPISTAARLQLDGAGQKMCSAHHSRHF